MNLKHKISIAAFAAVLSAALVVPASASALAGVESCAGSDATISTANTAALADTTRCLLLAERASAGLGQPGPSGQMTSVASRQVGDVISTGVYGHIGADGANIVERVRSTGFLSKFKKYTVGEILCYGQGTAGTPAAIVDAWMNSPSHRNVILHGRFRQVGISVQAGSPVAPADTTSATYGAVFGFKRS
jgi:uncharacterized protein YkwD